MLFLTINFSLTISKIEWNFRPAQKELFCFKSFNVISSKWVLSLLMFVGYLISGKQVPTKKSYFLLFPKNLSKIFWVSAICVIGAAIFFCVGLLRCRRWDSDPQAYKGTRLWTARVCQFHHFGIDKIIFMLYYMKSTWKIE